MEALTKKNHAGKKNGSQWRENKPYLQLINALPK